MERVPTWTELRLDAKKLAKIQKECYNSVHRLLDLEIPKLDRKISMLSGKSLSSQESTSIDLNDNPHLKAPPLPLSEYLMRNRPEVVRRATNRALYVKTRADRRKFRNETKLINSFKCLRLASNHRPMQNNKYCNPKPTKSTNFNPPAYNLRHQFSDSEMKKLTARTYKRLPEVKMRHKEEVTNQMRALNYKNKLEYARKLAENRKNGIINYPLA